MATHELKCWPEYFDAILDGSKRYEIRRNDRGYAVGDVIHLREWEPRESGFGTHTERETYRVVTYMTSGGDWGLPADLCVMLIAPLTVHS